MDRILEDLKEGAEYMMRVNSSNQCEILFKIFLRNYGFLIMGSRNADNISMSRSVSWEELRTAKCNLIIENIAALLQDFSKYPVNNTENV